MTFKIVNANNGNETKSDIFPWDIFKSDAISFLSKNIKASPNIGNETKSNIFPWGIFKPDAISFYQKILKHFNDFQSRNFSVV